MMIMIVLTMKIIMIMLGYLGGDAINAGDEQRRVVLVFKEVVPHLLIIVMNLIIADTEMMKMTWRNDDANLGKAGSSLSRPAMD